MTRRQHRQSSRWRRTISLLCMLSDQKIKVSYSRKPENLTVMISKMFSYCFSPLARGNDFFFHIYWFNHQEKRCFFFEKQLTPEIISTKWTPEQPGISWSQLTWTCKLGLLEQWKKPSLFRVFTGLYYPVIYRDYKKPLKGSLWTNQ